MISTLNKLINRLSMNNILGQTHYFRQLSSIDPTDKESDIWTIDRDFDDLTVDKFKDLITDKTTEEKISSILSEYEYEKYTTLRVPTTITTEQMKDLLSIEDFEERRKWFLYFFKKQNARIKTLSQQKHKSEEYWKRKREEYSRSNVEERTGMWDKDGQLIYGLWHNTLFSKILRNSVARYYGHRLRTAALFGQKLVIDIDYDQYMKLSECRLMAKQIHLLYNFNRFQSQVPFDLHFTNCNHNLPTVQTMKKYFPHHESAHFMADFHQKSYTELFPKERLVYLSPHSELTLRKHDPNDIYVIGAMLDKSYRHPISYTKAKKEGIRCMKLPINDHIIWSAGSKSLCINHIVEILHDISITGDFGKALRDRIPKRKQKSIEDIEMEDSLRKQKLNRMKKMTKFDPKVANNYF